MSDRRRVSFPRIWPARAVASRTLPVTLQPTPPNTVPGPLRPASGFEAVRPPSAAIIDADARSPGRSFLGRTEDALNAGPVPDRIDRETTARNAGIIAHNQIAGWPYDGNDLLVPHTVIPRRPITVTPFSRTIDTGVTIPAIAIGDPVT